MKGMGCMRLSAILPAYRVEKYLERCVNSLLGQLNNEDEIIIVDDGSPDRSGQIAESLAAMDARIHVLHKENGGLASARNHGLAKAAGDFVTFVDSDDYVSDDYVQVIRQHADSGLDILGFGYIGIQNSQRTGVVLSRMPEGLYLERAIKEQIVPRAICKSGIFGRGDLIFTAWVYAYRRSFLLENNLSFRSEREIIHEDYLFNIQALLKAKSLFILHHPLYCYDKRAGSLSTRYHPDVYKTKQMLFRCYEEALQAAGLLAMMRRPMNGFWILSIYDCIFHAAWKYSPLTLKEQREKIKEYLQDNRLQTAIREYPGHDLTLAGKWIVFLMRKRMAFALCIGYQAFEKWKSMKNAMIWRQKEYPAAMVAKRVDKRVDRRYVQN